MKNQNENVIDWAEVEEAERLALAGSASESGEAENAVAAILALFGITSDLATPDDVKTLQICSQPTTDDKIRLRLTAEIEYWKRA